MSKNSIGRIIIHKIFCNKSQKAHGKIFEQVYKYSIFVKDHLCFDTYSFNFIYIIICNRVKINTLFGYFYTPKRIVVFLRKKIWLCSIDIFLYLW